MLEQHSGKTTTWRWRSLATPLPVSDEMGLERLERIRTRTVRCPREEFQILPEQSTRQRGHPPSVQPSCGSHRGPGQSELGELQGEMAKSLLPWLSPPGTYQTLQETNWFVRCTVEGSPVIYFHQWRVEIKEISHIWATDQEMHCDHSIPSLVTPSSEVSPFY